MLSEGVTSTLFTAHEELYQTHRLLDAREQLSDLNVCAGPIPIWMFLLDVFQHKVVLFFKVDKHLR